MVLQTYDFIAIAIYMLLMLVVALLTRGVKSFDEFAVGSRSLPFSLLFASIAATYVGPGGSIGFAGKGFSDGLVFFLLAALFPLQSVLTGLFVVPRIAALKNCSSVGDVFAEKYGKSSKLISGVISVGLCLGFSAIMAMVGGKMLSSFTGMSMLTAVLIMSGITTFYVFTGGLRASVVTDVLQFSIFTLVVPIFLFLALKKMSVPLADVSSEALKLTVVGFEKIGLLALLGMALSFLLGEMLIPPYVNRALAGKGQNDAKRGFVLSGFFGFAWLVVIFGLGVVARFMLPPDTVPDNVFMSLASQVLPAGLYGLLVIAILGIVMSSQDSVINAGATTAVRDVLFIFGLQKKQELIAGKLLTILIAVVAGAIALYLPSIIESVLICYTIWAPTVAVPLVAALFLRKKSPSAGVMATLGGATGVIVWGMVLNQPYGIPAVLVGLGTCLAGLSAGFIYDSKKGK